MPDNALALIQAKISEIEEKLAKLRVTEKELSKMLGGAAAHPMPTGAVRRGRPPKLKEPVVDTAPGRAGSLTSRIREFLQVNSPTTAQAIADALGVETRPVSFALQTMKRKGGVKSAGREWSTKGRRRPA